jgi:CCR4-NOT transcription complex subunit 7/8
MVEGVTSVTPSGETLRVREVWEDNLEQEMEIVRQVIDKYPYVAMDTEFPGVVVRPVGNFKNSSEYHYQTLRCNVDMLKLIQLGLTLSDREGNLPKHDGEICVWQFNFREFELESDIHAEESIELLKTSGIDFEAMEKRGIDVLHFGELLMCSGVVLNDRVNWITFHSGYDFGYLMKVLTCKDLPDGEAEFFDLWKTFFPRVFDMKYLCKYCNGLHGGLNKIAEIMNVERIGPQHQAGSDSLLTLSTFMKMVKSHFRNNLDSIDKHCSVLYGLGSDAKDFLGENGFTEEA